MHADAGCGGIDAVTLNDSQWQNPCRVGGHDCVDRDHIHYRDFLGTIRDAVTGCVTSLSGAVTCAGVLIAPACVGFLRHRHDRGIGPVSEVLEEALGPLDPLPEAATEAFVAPPLLDVAADRRPHHISDGHIIDACNRLELLRLLGGKAQGHRLHGLHITMMAGGGSVCKVVGSMVSWCQRKLNRS